MADLSPGQQQGFAYGTGTTPTGMAQQIGGTTGDIYSAISGMALPQQQQYLQGGLQQAQGLLGNWAGQGPVSAQGVAQDAQSMMTPVCERGDCADQGIGSAGTYPEFATGGRQRKSGGGIRRLAPGRHGGRGAVAGGPGRKQHHRQPAEYRLRPGADPGGQPRQYPAATREGAASSLASMYGNAGSALAGYGQTDLSNALTTGSGLPQQYLQNLLGIGGLQQSQQQAGLNAQMGQYYGPTAAADPEPRSAALRRQRRALRHHGAHHGNRADIGQRTGTTTPSTVDQIGAIWG